MKSKFLKVLSLCMLLALVVGAVPAFAIEEIKTGYMPEQTFWAGERTWSIGIYGTPDGAKLVSVKSSKPKVLKVTKTSSDPLDGISWTPLKPGTSKVSVTYKDKEGKKTTISANYTVKKMPSPFSKLKVNGKSVKPSSMKNIYSFNKYTKTSATITFKAKSGWKVVEKGFEVFGKDRKTLKSGKKYKIPKGKDAYAVIGLQNKKTGDRVVYFFEFYR